MKEDKDNLPRDVENAVPHQHDGNMANALESAELDSAPNAIEAFTKLKQLLKQVNSWDKYSAPGMHFKLIGTDGNALARPVEEGDFIRIAVPASGSADGSGYDWVRVTETGSRRDEKTDQEIFWLTVRPDRNPQTTSENIAHFFDRESSNTFVASRNGRKVSVGVFGRNEKTNTEVETFSELLRDLVINLGAKAGLSGLTWKIFASSLLESALKDSGNEQRK